MKVLLLAPQPFFSIRGTPINVRNLAGALGGAGHEVHLLCYPLGEHVAMQGVRILRVAGWPGLRHVSVGFSLPKILLDIQMFFMALRLCMKNKYDVIHAVEESAFFAVMLKRLFRCKLVYDMDSCISEQLKYTGAFRLKPMLALANLFEKHALQHSDHVLSVCESLTQTARTLAPDVPITQIEDAPLDETFRPAEDGAQRLRDEFQLGADPVVVYTGNFESYQGVDLLLKAAIAVMRECPKCHFVLAGGEAEQVARYQKIIHDLGLDQRCHLAGRRPIEEMPSFMTLATILVSPRSKGGNTALKLYTYMQSGKPIVATRLATHTQVLDDSNAILVMPQAGDISEGIIRALREPLLSNALGRAAQEKVSANYSLPSFRHKVRELYSSL